jgi:hypothetical protein
LPEVSVRGGLALQRVDALRALVGGPKLRQSDGAEEDEERDEDAEGDEELRADRRGDPRREPRECLYGFSSFAS